jgi:hypothetical protein
LLVQRHGRDASRGKQSAEIRRSQTHFYPGLDLGIENDSLLIEEMLDGESARQGGLDPAAGSRLARANRSPNTRPVLELLLG